MHLIFDTETSGFLQSNYPFNHPLQGRILQIAALLLDDDFKEVGQFHSLIDIPDHVIINEGAARAHGISKATCKKYGMPIEAAIIVMDAFRAKSQYQIGHNISFDMSMIHQEETSIFGAPRLMLSNQVCTMHLMTDICKLPHPKYPKKFKWPKLAEAYRHLFQEDFDKAHTALADVRATARIYKYLFLEGYIDKIIDLGDSQP